MATANNETGNMCGVVNLLVTKMAWNLTQLSQH